MIRAVLIEDEINSSELLEWQLKQYCPDVQVERICTSGEEALKVLPEIKPDLIFLDIQMPGMSGFDLLEKLESIDFAVIFVTAYDHYAIKAFRFSAIDYLLKPIESTDLIDAIEKVKKSTKKDNDEQFKLMMSYLNKLKTDHRVKKIALSTSESFQFLDIDEVIYCESERNYTYMHFLDGKKILITKTLKLVEEILGQADFMRVHQSYLINLNYVKTYMRDSGGYLVMSNGISISVAKNKREELLKHFSKI